MPSAREEDAASHASVQENDFTVGDGAVRIIASIEDPVVIEKILAHLDKQGAATELSRLPESRAPPQAGLFD